MNTPIRRTLPVCCVRTASRHVMAEPSMTLMKSRRRVHQSIVAHRRPSAAVSAATNRHKEFMLTSEAQGRNNVSFVCTKRNESGPAVNPSIPDSSSFVVTGVRR
jgi:hypothetical protein